MKPASRTALAASATIVSGLDHELVSACEKPYTSANNPVEARPVRPALIAQQAQRHRRRRDRDRQVDVQAPAPRDGLGQRAAEQQPERCASAGDRAEDAERLGAIRRPLERHRQQSERGGREQRSERALKCPRGDQHPEGLSHAADR
jgi:hypothetical protein